MCPLGLGLFSGRRDKQYARNLSQTVAPDSGGFDRVAREVVQTGRPLVGMIADEHGARAWTLVAP
jgi:hypothetical protein